MPSASALYSGALLTAVDLAPLGTRRNAIIHLAAPEEVGQDRKRMLVLQLTNQNGQPWPKKVPLNKTNTLAIVNAYGDDYLGWPGKAITIWSDWVMFQGKRIPGIQIQPGPAIAAPPVPPASAIAHAGLPPVAGDSDHDDPDAPIADDEIPF